MATVTHEIKLNISGEKQAADKISKSIEDSLKRGLSTIGLGNITKGMGVGAGAGVAAGGTVALLGFIADTLKDFPIITATMKLLKLILTLFMLPLIPVMKPVLQALMVFIKLLTPIMMGLEKFSENFGIGKISDILGKLDTNKIFGDFKDLGKYLFDQLTAGWDMVGRAGQFIWNTILLPTFMFLSTAGQAIWNTILKPAFMFLSKVGETIWNTILKPAWDWFSDIGVRIWNIISAPFQWLAGQIKGILGWFGGGGAKTTTVKDAIISPGGNIVKTDPKDFLIATKNPGGMGGSTVVNITIQKPTIRDERDTRELVRLISQEQQKALRRYTSYV